MLTKRVIFIWTVMACLWCAGCGTDNSGTNPTVAVNGTRLLGLVDGRRLLYLVTDTVTTLSPYSQRVATYNQTLSITGNQAGWVLTDGDHPFANLKVSDPYVLHNGVWFQRGGADSLMFLPDPVILMQKSFQTTAHWTGQEPLLPSDSGAHPAPLYYVYYGFFFERAYKGTDNIIVPNGAYRAHRFDVQLFFNQSDSLPSASATEWYAPDVGLVKLRFKGLELSRTISLVSYQ